MNFALTSLILSVSENEQHKIVTIRIEWSGFAFQEFQSFISFQIALHWFDHLEAKLIKGAPDRGNILFATFTFFEMIKKSVIENDTSTYFLVSIWVE